MASSSSSSVVLIGSCGGISLNMVPNIMTCRRRGRPSKELHGSWIINSRKDCCSLKEAVGCRSHSWISAISATSRDELQTLSSTLPSRISPWLMLPPSFDKDNNNMLVYKFYSLKDDKVISIDKRSSSGDNNDDDEVPPDDCLFKGSSHGWLVLYNPRNSDIFLSNPLSRRHIKLPSILSLDGITERNLDDGYGCVKSVILSSSPEEQDCRAILIYGLPYVVAFCCPGSTTTKWSYIHAPYRYSRYQEESCVYSSTQKRFFCVNSDYNFKFGVLDVHNPVHPHGSTLDCTVGQGENFPWAASSEEEFLLKGLCTNINFLVVSDRPNSTSSDLLLVTRHTMKEMFPDGSNGIKTLFDEALSHCHYDAYGMRYPYKTIDFTVHKYDPDKEKWNYMDGSLDGLAIFIGNNHSFAMRATDFPELQPDSIYFTDVPDLIESASNPKVCKFGGHDIGIYNYKDKTFLPCYYPCDYQSIKRIEPAPMWFTPSRSSL